MQKRISPQILLSIKNIFIWLLIHMVRKKLSSFFLHIGQFELPVSQKTMLSVKI